MRWLLPVLSMVIVAILLSGCTQPAAPAATPAPTPTPTALITTPETTPDPATSAPAVQKQIDISATQVGSDVVVRYRGGADAADVSALDITIVNSNGQATNELEQVFSDQVQTGEGGDLLYLLTTSGKGESQCPAVFRGDESEKDRSHRLFRCPPIRSGDTGHGETDIGTGCGPYPFRHGLGHLCTDCPMCLDESSGPHAGIWSSCCWNRRSLRPGNNRNFPE